MFQIKFTNVNEIDTRMHTLPFIFILLSVCMKIDTSEFGLCQVVVNRGYGNRQIKLDQ